VRAYEQCCQAEHEPIERSEIRDAVSGAVADLQLMFEKQRLGGDGASATGAHELGDSDDEVNSEE
jgi:hypothetical protein